MNLEFESLSITMCIYFWNLYLEWRADLYLFISAKGRTNVELREQFILAQGVSQSMSPFVSKSPSGSSGSSSYSGASWSTRSPSSATGPITKVMALMPLSTWWRIIFMPYLISTSFPDFPKCILEIHVHLF